jgi:hypothetical protein
MGKYEEKREKERKEKRKDTIWLSLVNAIHQVCKTIAEL